MNKVLKSFGVAVLLAALLVGTGAAGDTTTVEGTVVNSTTINVLDTAIPFGNLAVGDNTFTTDTPDLLEIATNYAVVIQASGTNSGHMYNSNLVDTLDAALKVGIDTFTPVAIDGSGVTVSNTITAGTDTSYDGTLIQTVGASDPVNANPYSITVTFTTTTP